MGVVGHLLPAPGVVEPWCPPPCPVDPWLVLRLCRYRRPESVPEEIRSVAAAMAGRAGELAEPRAWLAAVEIAEVGPEGARLAGGHAFSGRAIGRLLAGCPLAVPFVLTLGPRLEAEAAALADRRALLESFLLETAGWAAIESALRTLRADLRARARARGWRVSPRLGPGLGDWPLAEQRMLLDLVKPAEGQVRLTEHGVLVPVKSVTGLYGLGPEGRP